MQCADCGTPSLAVNLLTVGSLGIIDRPLCAGHQRLTTAPFDASLVSYQLTGIERSPSAAEALAADLADENTANEKLRAYKRQLENENDSLRDELDSRRLQESTELRADLAQLQAENKRLSGLLAAASSPSSPSSDTVVEGKSTSDVPPTNRG